MALPAPTIALTYNGFVTQLAALAVVQVQTVNGVVVGLNTDNWDTVTTQAIQYAELRIQRDLELLPFTQINSTYSLTAGGSSLAVSVNDLLIIQTMSVFLPGGGLSTLTPVTKEFIQNVYDNPSVTGAPQFFAMVGGDAATFGQTFNNIAFGPNADQNYAVQLVGQGRMPSLALQGTQANAATGTTYISTWAPDLMLMAAMIYISGVQRNFGRQSDDPSMAVSYEQQYAALLAGVKGESYRQKFEADAWSAQTTSPVATPSRGA